MFDTLISLAILLFAIKKIANIQTMTIVDFAIVSFGFTYGLVPMISSQLGGGLQFSDWVTIQYGIGIFLFILGMYFISHFASFRTLKELTKIVTTDRNMLFVTFFIVVGIRLILALRFGNVLGGLSINPNLQTEYLQILVTLDGTLSCTLWILLAKCVSDRRSFFLETILALEFIFVFLKGRRVFLVFFSVLAIFFRFSKRWRNRSLYEYFGAAIAVTVFVVLSILYQPFRIELSGQNVGGFAQAAEHIFDLDPRDIINENSKNVRDRDLIYVFHKRIIEEQETKDPMLGGALFSAFVLVIPSFIYPEKIEKKNSKLAILRYYGMPEIDTAASLAATGQADWGLLGTFLYGCLFALFLKFFESMFRKFGNSLIGIFTLGALFFVAGNVEEGADDIFSSMRNFLIIFGLTIFMNFIIPKSPKLGSSKLKNFN